MKAGTRNRKYKYIPPEQRIGKREAKRRTQAIIHNAIRKKCPEFAAVEDYLGNTTGHYYDDVM